MRGPGIGTVSAPASPAVGDQTSWQGSGRLAVSWDDRTADDRRGAAVHSSSGAFTGSYCFVAACFAAAGAVWGQ